MARRSEAGEKNFEIRMDPPELGRIDVKMQVSTDGKVSAALAVERPETLELLTRDSRALEQALKDTGLDVGSGALSFSLRDQNAKGAHADANASASAALDGEAEAEVQTAAQEHVWFGMPKGLLDIKV
jgi:flagellar hook-length control protein FliK